MLWLLCFVFTATGACRNQREEPLAPAIAATPVFLISIDTLRSDRLPAYGYARGATPAIDAFRRDAVLFRNVFSHYPMTLPSHASIFSGTLPPAHGVRDNLGYTLSPAHITLATRLKEKGYRTGGAVSSYVLRRSTGIAEGFEFYDDSLEYEKAVLRSGAERSGEKTRLALEGWLEGVSGRNVFGFLHIFEPHAPYAPPPEYVRKDFPYDGEVSYSDAIVGRFLESLKRRGLYDDALIILLSDHGEGLGDHGEDEHGVFLYRESLQVPLLIKLPDNRSKGEAKDQITGLIDVAPTVLALLGITGGDKMDGVNAFANAQLEDRHIYSETYYPRLHFGWHELRSEIGRQFHFIDAPQKELYDYRSDPQEKSNVIDANRRIAFSMDQRLASTPSSFQPPSVVDPEDQRKLASLGYLGSASPSGKALPDPKTKVGALRQIRLGFDLVSRSEYARAVTHLEKFTRENPDVLDGWWLLGQSLARTGRPEEGLKALKEAARRFPANTSILLTTADVLFAMSRYDEARSHAELAVTGEPVIAREFLARMAIKRKNFAEAEKYLRTALEQAPTRTDTMMLLADALRGQNRRGEELPLLERILGEVERQRIAPIQDVQFFRGEALLSQRRIREAELAFKAETEAFPANRKAWSSLALVVGGQQRKGEARAILLEGLRRNPDRRMADLALESFSVMGDSEGIAEMRRIPLMKAPGK